MFRLAAGAFAALLVLVAPAASQGQADVVFASSFETDASSQIAAARAAPDGPAALPVAGAVVTYLKPATGVEPAGLFVQGGTFGPALFVRIDPTLLAPPAQSGDNVSFTVAELATNQSRREVVQVTDYTRNSTGQPLGPLTQDVSGAVDLVAALSSYESERIAISGAIANAFVAAGTGFQSARLDTAGIVGDANLVLRAPTTLVDALELTVGCAITASGVPMWRFNQQAQPSAFASSDFTLIDCPAPRVVSALALTMTSVQIDFDRNLQASSVDPGGSQFAFDGGLVATGATVSGRSVNVTTEAQVPGFTYTVSVAASVTDLGGKGVDPAFDSAAFTGFQVAAMLVLNEINSNVTSSRDLVELLAVSGGSVGGMQMVQDPGAVGSGVLLVTLPNFSVAAGDLIVVHFAPAGETDETLSKTQCADVACFANAWDVRGSAAGLTYSNRVLAVRSPIDGSLPDVVVAARTDLGTPPAAFPANVQFVQNLGHWLPGNCGGAPCTYVSTPTVVDISVIWTGLSNMSSGNSIQRGGNDTNVASDWQLRAQTFGAANQ